MEVERFGAYLRAVEDPLSVLDDAAGGWIAAESVEALEAVYPSLLADLRTRVTERLATHPGQMSYKQRLSLGHLLGIETDPSMNPAFIASIQAMHATRPERLKGSPGASPARMAKRIAAEFSPSDALSERSA